MNLKEFYDTIEGDYDEVLQRLMRPEMIQKFVKKFLEDESFSKLMTALEQDEQEEAFRAAHTLKGVCQTLGLGKLLKSSVIVTDALRNGRNDVTQEMLLGLQNDYQNIVEAIQQIS